MRCSQLSIIFLFSLFLMGLNSLLTFHMSDRLYKEGQYPLESPAKNAAPKAVVSVVSGLITLTSSKFD